VAGLLCSSILGRPEPVEPSCRRPDGEVNGA